jgi:predicted transcriptional regulator
MKDEKLDEFLKKVVGLKTGEFSKRAGFPATTLRERWKNPKKRHEIIYLAVGFAAGNGEYANKLIKEFC